MIDAWTLFNKHFKENDYVIIINEFDKMFFGRMKTVKIGLSLTMTEGKPQFFYWDDIRFIAHDGFPCKKLLGSDGSDTIELLESVETEKLIRSSLRLSKLKMETGPDVYVGPHRRVRQIVFADPYLIEDTSIELINTHYPDTTLWEPGTEELLLMSANDGAIGMLYELNRIYHYETQ